MAFGNLHLEKTIVLTDEQERVAALIDEFMADPSQQVFLIHGLAGTGKTTLLAHTALQYDHASLCTLTGKAASILRRKTGLPAQTIHSFFYNLIEVGKDKVGRQVLKSEQAHHHGQLNRRLVLVDEVSMIDETTANDLRRTGAKIIATGDPGQLPPIKGNAGFRKPDYILTEIHRQALDSPIIRQAHRVRAGKPYQADGQEFRVQQDGTDDDLRNAEVVLCWTNRTRHALNNKCRRLLGYWQSHPQVGEPLMCLKNVTSQGIFNGAVYRLLQPFGQGDRNITIDVDGVPVCLTNVNFEGIPSILPNHVEATTTFGFGYAMTVHKAQGSEWDSVVLYDEYRRSEERREWLYTAVTRAAQKILVVR
jgi:exodeoxyribonuclease V